MTATTPFYIADVIGNAISNTGKPANLAVGFTKFNNDGNPIIYYATLCLSADFLPAAIAYLSTLSPTLLQAFHQELKDRDTQNKKAITTFKYTPTAKYAKQCDYSVLNADLIALISNGGYVLCKRGYLDKLEDHGAENISTNGALALYHKA